MFLADIHTYKKINSHCKSVRIRYTLKLSRTQRISFVHTYAVFRWLKISTRIVTQCPIYDWPRCFYTNSILSYTQTQIRLYEFFIKYAKQPQRLAARRGIETEHITKPQQCSSDRQTDQKWNKSTATNIQCPFVLHNYYRYKCAL